MPVYCRIFLHCRAELQVIEAALAGWARPYIVIGSDRRDVDAEIVVDREQIMTDEDGKLWLPRSAALNA